MALFYIKKFIIFSLHSVIQTFAICQFDRCNDKNDDIYKKKNVLFIKDK